jgi:hypothetical protein
LTKYIFWSVLHKNVCIALTEDLSRYAQGETFWKAMLNLCEALQKCTPSRTNEESDFNARLKMYYETGVNKIEIFVEKEAKRFTVRCSNSRSSVDAKNEQDALFKYVEVRAKTSDVNAGDPNKI